MRVKCDELRDAIGHMVAAALEGDFNHRMTQDFEFPDLNAFAASMNELVEKHRYGSCRNPPRDCRLSTATSPTACAASSPAPSPSCSAT